MALQRISPGKYKDPKTGKVYNLANPKQIAAKEKELAGAAKKAAAKPAGKGKTIPGTNIGKITSGTKPVNQALDVGLESGIKAAKASAELMNPEVINPFGRSKYDSETGTVTQELSDNQQKILDQGEALTQQGQQKAAANLGGYQQYKADTSGMGNFNFQSDDAARQRIEDATFQRLSRGMDQRQKQQSADLEQSLYNRGIQFSNDPNSRYQQELQSMKQEQEAERQSYMEQAVGMGGQEMSRNYDIASGTYGTNLAGNQARNTAMQGQQQQMMSDTANLQGMGTGLMVPNFQEFQGSPVDMGTGASTAATFAQLQQQKPVDDANAAYLRSKTRTGSGGGGTSGGSSGQPQVFFP